MFSFYLRRTKETVRSEGKTVLFLVLSASSTFPYEFLLPGDADIRPEVIFGVWVTVWRFYMTINQADFFFFAAQPSGGCITDCSQSIRPEMAEIYGELLPRVSGGCLVRLHAYSVWRARRRGSGHVQTADHYGSSLRLYITLESSGCLGL